MKICTGCKKEVETFKHGKKCEECRKEYLKNLHRKKQIHNCGFCGEKFYKLKLKECSIKCYLLSRIENEKECWIWKKQLNESGYGKIKRNKMHLLAHRESYKVHKGEIPKGILVLHSCNNPACINPDHLRLGTHRENMDDRTIAGNIAGERNPATILKWDQVRKIREYIAQGISQAEIGRIMNIKKHLIWAIKSNKTWKENSA